MSESVLCGPMPWWDDACRALDASLDAFVARWRNTERKAARSRVFPREIISEFAEMGLYGLLIPQEYGGQLAGPIDHRVVAILGEHFGRIPSMTMHYMASAVGGARPIAEFGTEEQRQQWLPAFASGNRLAAISLTEPFAGSDLTNLETTATQQADGTWMLSGLKRFTSNIGVADVYMVLARIQQDHDRPARQPKVAYFLLPKGIKGLSIGKINEMAGYEWLRNGTLVLDRVHVDGDAMLAAPNFGWDLVTAGLNIERLLNLGACVGAMRESVSIAAAYVGRRLKNGDPLANTTLIQVKLGEMAAEFHSARVYMHALAEMSAAALDPTGILMGLGKMRAAAATLSVTNEAVRRMGGDGYTRDYGVEAFWRNSRLWETGGGTSDVLAMRAGKRLAREGTASPWTEGATVDDLVEGAFEGDTVTAKDVRSRLRAWHRRHPGLWARPHDIFRTEAEASAGNTTIATLAENGVVEVVHGRDGMYVRLSAAEQVDMWRELGPEPLPDYMAAHERF